MAKKGNHVNTNLTTNQRLVTILLVLLIVLVVLLIIGIVAGWLWMGGGMTLAPGASAGVEGMMGMNGQMMNNMMYACTEMMRSFQNP